VRPGFKVDSVLNNSVWRQTGYPTNVNTEVLTHQYHISGRAVVRIAESDLYFGPHDSAESIGRHAVLVDIY
jgi:hypothetical protein